MYVFTWTPLVDASMFTGINTDVLTVASGLIAIALSIVGVFFILRAMNH
jgi:hypothetical protein